MLLALWPLLWESDGSAGAPFILWNPRVFEIDVRERDVLVMRN